MNTYKPTHIRPFSSLKEKHIASLSWLEAAEFQGKAGSTYTLCAYTHHDYSKKGLQIFLQQYIHGTPCLIRRKVYHLDDNISWISKDNDWVKTKEGCLKYEWLVTLTMAQPYNQYFNIITTTSENSGQHTIEYEFGIIVGV